MVNACKPLLCFLQRPLILLSFRLEITFFCGFAMKLGLVFEFNHQTLLMRFAILRLEGLVGHLGRIAVSLLPSAFSPLKKG